MQNIYSELVELLSSGNSTTPTLVQNKKENSQTKPTILTQPKVKIKQIKKRGGATCHSIKSEHYEPNFLKIILQKTAHTATFI